jgi:hypothetical protein
MLGGDLDSYPLPPAKGWTVCEVPPDTKTTSGFPVQEPFDAFVAYLAVTCTTRGLDMVQMRERSLAAFQVYEDAVVEDQFWKGTIQPANPHLTDSNAVVLPGGAQDIVSGFALLEQYAASKQQAGIIHLSPWLATYAAHASLIVREGAVLRTQLGSLVVPGMGYTGAKPESASAPPAGSEYAFVTNGVRVMRAEPYILGQADAEAVTRSSNDFTIIVEREYLVAWDGAVQGAVLIDPTPVV